MAPKSQSNDAGLHNHSPPTRVAELRTEPHVGRQLRARVRTDTNLKLHPQPRQQGHLGRCAEATNRCVSNAADEWAGRVFWAGNAGDEYPAWNSVASHHTRWSQRAFQQLSRFCQPRETERETPQRAFLLPSLVTSQLLGQSYFGVVFSTYRVT